MVQGQIHAHLNGDGEGYHGGAQGPSSSREDRHYEDYGGVETSDIDSSWDSRYGEPNHRTTPVIPNHKGVNSPIVDSWRPSSSLHNREHPNSCLQKSGHPKLQDTHEKLHSVPSRETGAIPKTRSHLPASLPSPAHPDEIICLPMDDLTPPRAAGATRHAYNYAH